MAIKHIATSIKQDITWPINVSFIPLLSGRKYRAFCFGKSLIPTAIAAQNKRPRCTGLHVDWNCRTQIKFALLYCQLLNCTLSPASHIVSPWLMTWSHKVALISFESWCLLWPWPPLPALPLTLPPPFILPLLLPLPLSATSSIVVGKKGAHSTAFQIPHNSLSPIIRHFVLFFVFDRISL